LFYVIESDTIVVVKQITISIGVAIYKIMTCV